MYTRKPRVNSTNLETASRGPLKVPQVTIPHRYIQCRACATGCGDSVPANTAGGLVASHLRREGPNVDGRQAPIASGYGATSLFIIISVVLGLALGTQVPANAQTLPGPFDEFNSRWLNPANGTLGVIPGANICIDLDGDSTTESCYAQPTVPAGALTNLRLSPTRRILLAFGNTAVCNGSSMVHFFDVPDPPGALTLIDSACIPNNVNAGQVGFYDTGLCCDGLTDLACAGALGLDCSDGMGGTVLGISPQRIAYVADQGSFSTQRVQIHWFDLVGGTHATTFPGFNQQLPLTRIQVSPYGDVAFIQHDVGGASDSDYTAVDLCGGSRLGTPLFSNVGGALFDLPLPIATADMIDNGGSFSVRVTHPDLTGGSLDAAFTPCSGDPPPTNGACCESDGCSQETAEDCENMGGSWLGPNTDCVDCPTATLTVAVSGPGSVNSNPSGISCPADCDETYAEGVDVTLTATPGAGAQFLQWGGNCFGTNPVTQVTLAGDRNCTATFDIVTDLAITKSDDVDPVIAGNALIYTLTVTNNGPSDAPDVSVNDTLPSGVTFDPAATDLNCGPIGSTVICELGELANGANTQVVIGVIVNPDTRGNINNRATVSADVTDSSPFNNTANESTMVEARADVSVTKSAAPDPVLAGGRLVYEIVVSNAGPSSATGVTTNDTLPPGVTALSDPNGTGQVGCGVPNGTVDVGQSAIFAFAARVDAGVADGMTLTNTIEVSADEIDPVPANNVFLLDTTVTTGMSAPAAHEFVKIADTSTPIPGGAGTFTQLAGGDKPVLSQGNVAFRGVGDNQDGIYRWMNGVLEVIADTNTPIPGGTGTFGAPQTGGFSIPSIDGEDVAFGGDDLTISQRGVYTYIGGVLDVVADKTTRPPGASTSFSTLGGASLDDGVVSFWGFIPAAPYLESIYVGNSAGLTLVANQNTFIPGGGGKFSGFNSGGTQYRRGNAAFFGRNSAFKSGIYKYIAGALQIVVDSNTLIPGGGGFMNLFFNYMSYDGSRLAFVGDNNTLTDPRLYVDDCVGFSVAVDTNTPVPCGTGNFTNFSDVAIHGGNMAFIGLGNAQSGIYADIGGKLIKVVGLLDVLDGKYVSGYRFGREGLYGDQLVFTAIFTDGSEGIFLASLSTSGVCNPYDDDADGDRDLRDFAAFASCQTGDGVPHAAGCEIFDADGDGDVDGNDYATFVSGLTDPQGSTVTETCCLPQGQGCTEMEPLVCEFAFGGTPMPGEDCANSPCGAGPGVCCSFKGCLDIDEALCNKLEGAFLPGESCANEPCGF